MGRRVCPCCFDRPRGQASACPYRQVNAGLVTLAAISWLISGVAGAVQRFYTPDRDLGRSESFMERIASMPVYEYGCTQCDHQFEEFSRTMNSRVLPACSSCGSSKVERRLSVFAARQEVVAKPAAGGAPCGRCGDPEGPWSF